MKSAELTIDNTPSISNPAHVRDLEELISMAQHEILQGDIQGEASITHYCKAGEYLEALKSQCKHGTWYKTLEKVGIGEDKADRYRKLYKSWHLLPITDLGVFSLRGALEYIKEKELPAQTSQTESPAIDVSHTEVVELREESEQRNSRSAITTTRGSNQQRTRPPKIPATNINGSFLVGVKVNAGIETPVTQEDLSSKESLERVDPRIPMSFLAKLVDSSIDGLKSCGYDALYDYYRSSKSTYTVNLSNSNYEPGHDNYHVYTTVDPIDTSHSVAPSSSLSLPGDDTEINSEEQVESPVQPPVVDARDEEIALLKQQLQERDAQIKELQERYTQLEGDLAKKTQDFVELGSKIMSYEPKVIQRLERYSEENIKAWAEENGLGSSKLRNYSLFRELCDARADELMEVLADAIELYQEVSRDYPCELGGIHRSIERRYRPTSETVMTRAFWEMPKIFARMISAPAHLGWYAVELEKAFKCCAEFQDSALAEIESLKEENRLLKSTCMPMIKSSEV